MMAFPRFVCRVRSGLLGVLAVVGSASAQAPHAAATLTDSMPTSPDALLQRYGYQPVSLTPYSEDGLEDGLYAVPVVLDTLSAMLLLDSGFNMNLTFHHAQADLLGLRGSASGTVAGMNYTPTVSTVDTVHVPQVTIGTMLFGAQSASIGQFPMADGAIGARFLTTYGAILDYPHDVLYLQGRPAGAVPLDALKRQGDVTIPLRRVVKGARAVYLIRGVVASKVVTLLLDTGWGTDSDGPVLDAGRAAALGLSGRSNVRFTIGTLQMDGLPLHTQDLSQVNAKLRSTGFPQIDGVLGAWLLKEHGALIDFGHEMLYLCGQIPSRRVSAGREPVSLRRLRC